jgi:hypothetical protein
MAKAVQLSRQTLVLLLESNVVLADPGEVFNDRLFQR